VGLTSYWTQYWSFPANLLTGANTQPSQLITWLILTELNIP